MSKKLFRVTHRLPQNCLSEEKWDSSLQLYWEIWKHNHYGYCSYH